PCRHGNRGRWSAFLQLFGKLSRGTDSPMAGRTTRHEPLRKDVEAEHLIGRFGAMRAGRTGAR
ncbi:MAG: hypothetical protein ACLPTZ_04565, partial [Beijerinckiaceae bacterium]